MRCVVTLLLLLPRLALADASVSTRAPGSAVGATVVYQVGTGAADDVKAYEITEYAPGQTAYRVDDGSAVVIEEKLERARVDGIAGDWYRVRGLGRVFSGGLTPLAWRADLDGDGTPEVIAVSFTADFKIRVRIGDSHLDLDPSGQAYLDVKGGRVDGRLLPPTVAGVPLVVVGSHPEACADYSETYVSYAGKQARVALTVSGVADPPVHATPRVRFDPRARSAVVTTTISDDDAPKKTRHQRKRYRLVDGVYQLQRL